MDIRIIEINPLSMVTHDGLQKIDISYWSKHAGHLLLEVQRDGQVYCETASLVCASGKETASVLLPVPGESFEAVWILKDTDGNELTRVCSRWEKPREWTWYVMMSSHIDIGLHNSQYEQRYDCSRILKKAMELNDETADREDGEQYRFTIEGTWVWNNYCSDQDDEAVQKAVKDYLQTGKMGICSGVAGNLIEVYGLEEMCRSTYEKKYLEEKWGIGSETLSMIDVNGLPMSLIQPYAEAGYKNIIFAPNQWNPLPSTVWSRDYLSECNFNCPETGGGGSRIDMRYESEMPMVFFWEDDQGNRVLVWGSTQYSHGGEPFGIGGLINSPVIPRMEQAISRQLPLMERKYPYSVWLIPCFSDNETYTDDGRETGTLDLNLLRVLRTWNQKWKWPKFQSLGNPDVPFDLLRREYGDVIPVLKGDITGGWYQLPVSTAELLSRKFEADRLLPTAEKWAVIASMVNGNYEYPETEFTRAWTHLLVNDDHSYGASGYKGRKVYETWLQHTDWMDKALHTGMEECDLALRTIASQIPAEQEKTVVFNSTAHEQKECVVSEDGEKYALVSIPALGYAVLGQESYQDRGASVRKTESAPVVENSYYKIIFKENGAISSVWDKELGKELLDRNCQYGANEILYTNDNHRSYFTPHAAEIEVTEAADCTAVKIRTEIDFLGAEIVQTITVPNYEKRIDIDNRIFHAKDMVNADRYQRYLYCAFPFMVPGARRYCHMNGSVAEYAKSITGHGTDVYMAVNEWCCSENDEFGAALVTLDSQLTEFDHIHPDKTDYGNPGKGSQIYAYLANDWLQRHLPGGSHLNFRFRYSITSYQGSYRTAGVPELAERYGSPVRKVQIGAQSGSLNPERESFLQLEDGQRLLTLKKAEDGRGIIARIYGQRKVGNFGGKLGEQLTAERNTIDEKEWKHSDDTGEGFATYRLGKNSVSIKTGERNHLPENEGTPAPIGSVYTGLISYPRACAGEDSGQMYILWGKNREEDLSHYKLYRSEQEDFIPDDSTWVADVLPSTRYCVERYTDDGLKENTRYYYKVCAVNKAGVKGPISEEISAYTQENEERLG